jgi:hypothetical protein
MSGGHCSDRKDHPRPRTAPIAAYNIDQGPECP